MSDDQTKTDQGEAKSQQADVFECLAVDAAIAFIRNVAIILASEQPTSGIKKLVTVAAKRARAYFGVEFWVKYGSRLKEEIEKGLKENIEELKKNGETPRT